MGACGKALSLGVIYFPMNLNDAPSDGFMDQVNTQRFAKFRIGQVVRHRLFPFRGVIFDVDPVFNNTEDWWLAIPETIRPNKEQPFYHLLAENSETEYVAYVSEQNLLPDTSGEPVRHPQVPEFFGALKGDLYEAREQLTH